MKIINVIILSNICIQISKRQPRIIRFQTINLTIYLYIKLLILFIRQILNSQVN